MNFDQKRKCPLSNARGGGGRFGKRPDFSRDFFWLPERWDFFREFVRNFWQKKVKYAIKTVIYKSWDWVKFPTFTEIFFGGSPYPRSSEVSKTSGSAASELELSISTLEILVKVCDCQIIQLITNTVLLLQKINVSKITFPCHLPKKVSLDFSLWLMCAPFLCQEPVQLVPASGLG